jgi:hypothetical protein
LPDVAGLGVLCPFVPCPVVTCPGGGLDEFEGLGDGEFDGEGDPLGGGLELAEPTIKMVI